MGPPDIRWGGHVPPVPPPLAAPLAKSHRKLIWCGVNCRQQMAVLLDNQWWASDWWRALLDSCQFHLWIQLATGRNMSNVAFFFLRGGFYSVWPRVVMYGYFWWAMSIATHNNLFQSLEFNFSFHILNTEQVALWYQKHWQMMSF